MSDKKKVLIIDLGKSYGGAEKLIENLIVGLKYDFDITMVINKYGEFKEKSEIINSIEILTLTNNSKSIIKNVCILKKYIKENNINIIHCHGAPSNIIGLILKKICDVKFVSTVHSDLMYEFEGKKKQVYAKVEKLTLRYADFIIAVSENLRGKLVSRYGKEDERIKIIYNGIAINNNISTEKTNDEKFKFIFVGRLVEIKNVELLLNGLCYIKNQRRSFICNIIGEGEDREKLENMSNALGLSNMVKFLGYRNDTEELMKNSDALLLTSKMEGIPITIIEAFANKLPVVSTAVGGVLEMIVNGETGLLFDLEDEQKFNEILLDLVDDKYDLNKLGENSYQEYLLKWNQKTLINEYKNIYLK